MEPLSSIQNKLRLYADAKIAYADFRSWISQAYSEHAEAGESEELRLCREIEWQCADYSEGLIAEPQLRQNLSVLTVEPEKNPLVRQPLIVGSTGYNSLATSGTSSSLQSGGAPVLLGAPQKLRETAPV
jgi:hypothetical protein